MTAQVMRPTGALKVHTLDWQSSSRTVAERFQKLFELAEWADCKFLVGSEEPRTEFLCHKLVLAASSPVFEALFYGSLAIQHEEPVVLPDMDPDHFQLFIKYLYTDTLSIPDMYTAQGILYAAKKYLIPHLATRCVRYLESNLTIDNLFDTLRTAECLKENKLRKHCLKLMCRTNPLHWWISDLKVKGSSTLSASSLSVLLDIMPLPDRELGVFNLLLTWSQACCQNLNLVPTPSQHRLLLDQSNLLCRVRFLRMSHEEFAQVKATGILTHEEAEHIQQCILLLESPHIASPNISNCSSLPAGFSPLTTPRNALLTKEQTYMRATLSNKTDWLYGSSGSRLQCSFLSEYSVLVSGFTMYTRLPFTNDYSKSSSDCTYEEKLKVTVQDEDNRTISTLNYHNPQVQYNSSIYIKLNEPFWTEPKKSYHILVEIERGQYPSQELANVVHKDQDRIEFKENFSDQMMNIHDEEITSARSCGLIAALTCCKYLPDQALLILEDD